MPAFLFACDQACGTGNSPRNAGMRFTSASSALMKVPTFVGK
jgi:hypothetical protein